jgi:uncharacterized protein YjbI with pentapeptide repeats
MTMDDIEDKKGQMKKKPRCDPKQLEFLKKCSEKKDFSEWYDWREEKPDEEIWLQGAHLEDAHLDGADLGRAHLDGAGLIDAHLEEAYLVDAHLEGAYLGRAHLDGADLIDAHLEGACLQDAHLEGANFNGAHLERANFNGAHLEGAKFAGAYLEGAYLSGAPLKKANLAEANLEGAWLINAHLEGANLHDAHLDGAHLDYAQLEGAYLWRAHLEGADLQSAHLEGVDLTESHLEGANLEDAHLEGADFSASVVDGSTLFWKCSVDRKTDFRGVGLDSCRIDERTKYLLQYNNRRLNWEDWYGGESEQEWVRKMRQLLTSPLRLFWFLSDYGRSTIRILLVFLALAIIFAVAYWWIPDCVMVNGQVVTLRNFLNALYLSVVTMTTPGFGNIAANPQSSFGQVLLMLQVFCGYFLLGAIVTRLAILFTAGGPAGRFSKKKV